ncbi:MAG TPA: hypothetical protein VIV58_04800 [Kofleriaceae bacterium]
MCKLLLLGALAACGRAGEARPDPWAGPAAPSVDKPTSDPWASGTALVATAPVVTDPPAHDEPGLSHDLDGRYACQIPTTKYNVYSHMTEVTYVPAGIEFWLDGDHYRSRGAAGSIAIANRVISFQDGDMDGWRAAINTHDDGRTYIVIRKDFKGDPRPGETTKFGDFYCGKQSS